MSQRAPAPTAGLADPFSDVAAESGMTCLRVEQWHLNPPWGLRFEAERGRDSEVLLHCVVRGKAVLTVTGQEPRTLGPGGTVVMPHKVSHALSSAGSVREDVFIARPPLCLAPGATANYQPGGGPYSTIILSTAFAIPGREAEAPPEVASPPAVLDGISGDALELVLLASKLVLLPGPGDRYVACRLAEAVLAKTLRRLAGADQDTLGLFGFFASVGIKLALKAVATDATRAWTIGELAGIAGMPRRAFVREFTDTVGVGVPEFIAMRRLRALDLVVAGGTALADGAAAVGFHSTAAVRRAVRQVRRFGARFSLPRLRRRDA